jgi:hypothetical protein
LASTGAWTVAFDSSGVGVDLISIFFATTGSGSTGMEIVGSVSTGLETGRGSTGADWTAGGSGFFVKNEVIAACFGLTAGADELGLFNFFSDLKFPCIMKLCNRTGMVPQRKGEVGLTR